MELIDRSKIEYHHENVRNLEDGHLWVERVATEDEIKDLPTVDAEPVRHGYWEKHEDADGIYTICFLCGTDTDISHYGKEYNYCPHCGAKMDAERREG